MINLKRVAALTSLVTFLTFSSVQTVEAAMSKPPIFLLEEESQLSEDEQIHAMMNAIVSHRKAVAGKVDISNNTDIDPATPESYVYLLNHKVLDTDTIKKLIFEGIIPSNISMKDIKQYVTLLSQNLSFEEQVKMLKSSITLSKNDLLVIKAYTKMRKASEEEFGAFMFSGEECIIDGKEVDMNMASDMVKLMLTLDAIKVMNSRFGNKNENNGLDYDAKGNVINVDSDYVLATNTVDSLIVALENVSMRSMAYEIYTNNCEKTGKLEMFKATLSKLGEEFPAEYSTDRIVLVLDTDKETTESNTKIENNQGDNGCVEFELDGQSYLVYVPDEKELSFGK